MRIFSAVYAWAFIFFVLANTGGQAQLLSTQKPMPLVSQIEKSSRENSSVDQNVSGNGLNSDDTDSSTATDDLSASANANEADQSLNTLEQAPAATNQTTPPSTENLPAQPVEQPAQTAAAQQPAQHVGEQRAIAVLQVLDKISARATTLQVPVGSTAAFGLLVIKVETCRASSPSEAPESAAFLEIKEIDVNSLQPKDEARDSRLQKDLLLYSGWMFASSPALAALENPVYDVTVLACENAIDSYLNGAGEAPEAANASNGKKTSSEKPVVETPED